MPAVVSALLTPLPVSCPLTTLHHYIYILFEFGLKACKKRKRLNEDSCITSQLQMAVVYIDYRLYASSDQTISGT